MGGPARSFFANCVEDVLNDRADDVAAIIVVDGLVIDEQPLLPRANRVLVNDKDDNESAGVRNVGGRMIEEAAAVVLERDESLERQDKASRLMIVVLPKELGS